MELHKHILYTASYVMLFMFCVSIWSLNINRQHSDCIQSNIDTVDKLILATPRLDNEIVRPSSLRLPASPRHFNISPPAPHQNTTTTTTPVIPETIGDEATKRIDELLVGCKDICNTDLQGVESKFFPQISKNVDCAGLWSNAEIDASRPSGPAPEIPASMLKHFVYGGRVNMGRHATDLLNQPYLDNTQSTFRVWTQELIDDWAGKCGNGQLEGTYGLEATRTLLDGLKQMTSIPGGNVLVIGSELPWVEACVLFAGASMVTTLEYGPIVSNHPKVKTLVPSDARDAFATGTLPLFDAVVTFSSVEHSGLGRYGDALNPWGDLQAIARAWCITKAGGGLLLGVPVGADSITFNAHRVYGPIMLSHLTSNWNQDYRLDCGMHGVYIFHSTLDWMS
jgi:Caenorhabditis protein of unknown function, DUF268